jgi:hypothetical protein
MNSHNIFAMKTTVKIHSMLSHIAGGVTAVLALLAAASAPASPYSSAVLSDHPLVFYPLTDVPQPDGIFTATNSGSLGAAGNGAHFPGAIHSVPGAIAGSADLAMNYSAIDTNSDDGGVPTIIPFNAALNPNGSFTVEAWLRPTEPGAGNAQCPMFNRDPNDAAAPNRMGWDFFQRDSATGWNFRMFNGNAHAQVFNITGGTYTVGQWCHLMAVYNAAAPSATLYINGQNVASSSAPSGTFNPNTYAALSIGGYGDGSQNPFVGDIDEVAVYATALTGAQALSHYQNGTNASRGTPYNSLVVADGAAEYLRLNEPARNVAANSGTLGAGVNATYVNTTNNVAGPQSPAYAGFDASNPAAPFDGATSYLEMENPAGLDSTNPVTLEAWILPAASQNTIAYVIAHGDDDTSTTREYLGIVSGSYQVGTANATASFAVPPSDLGGGAWIHLAGNWDGANWNLFRNGLLVATTPDPIGPTPIINANWAVGARGRWKYALGYPASGEQDVFSGSIAVPAIYGTALSTNRIAAHYSAGAYGATPLVITHSGGNYFLNWSAGTLQQATAVQGPYTDVPGAITPYQIPAGPVHFYRLRFTPN